MTAGETTHRLAIDVGGTFTDVVIVDDATGSVRFGKVLSTPADPSEGSLDGARSVLRAAGIDAGRVAEIVHATTVATNAVLERKGARTGLITTEGFRDTLEIGRENRYDIYDLGLRLPAPLVPRRLRREAPERIDYEGRVRRPLDEAAVVAALEDLVEREGIEALAICLLHSYADSAHERRVAELAAARYPQLAISLSHRVAAEVREFERTSTVVVDAYVKPLTRRYIANLSSGLAALGFRNQVSMMLSHGGIGPATQVAEEFPVRMIESGPAAGAIAAAYFARQALARPDAVAFDMGGTTAKMSLIRDGQPTVTHEYEVAHVHRFKHGSGLPLQISAVELLEIGAGGGSIAQVSELGLLTVGPRSAGAAPGPACYGRGGDRPTVTDADLLLGYLDGEHFLGGAMKLDAAAAARAMAEHLGGPLGMTPDALAWGIHDVVNEHMAAATRAHAVEKGVDLRQFALIAFGGAGPVHAYALARKLGLARVICPFGAGVASSIGCLVAAPAVDLATAFFGRLDRLDWTAAAARVAAMRREGERMLADLVEREGAGRLDVSFDLRCEGQGYAVTVPCAAARLDAASVAGLHEGFARRYVELYGHKPPDVPLEVLALRARVEHPSRSERLRAGAVSGDPGGDPCKGERRVCFDGAGGFVSTRVYDRYLLPAGRTMPGPAIVEERETSIVIGPDATFHVDPAGHVVIDITPAGDSP